MNELTEESYPAFFERFRDFHDACIKSIQVYFRWGLVEDQYWQALGIEDYAELIPATEQARVVRIELDLKDYAPAAPDDKRARSEVLGGLWTPMRLDLVGVTEYRCSQEANLTPFEIVFSASFRWESGLIWVNLNQGERRESATGVRQSPIYFACRSVHWDVFL